MRVTVIVLAAGASHRFGSAKQLHEIEGEPLVRRAARTALAVAPTLVVIPDRDSGFVPSATSTAIREALSGLDVTILENPDAAEGMASSIRVGVRGCQGDVLVTLCDQFQIDASHLAALIHSGAAIAATSYASTLGVPAFFAAEFREELLALRGDRGAKVLLERHSSRVTAIPLEVAAIDLDRDPA